MAASLEILPYLVSASLVLYRAVNGLERAPPRNDEVPTEQKRLKRVTRLLPSLASYRSRPRRGLGPSHPLKRRFGK